MTRCIQVSVLAAILVVCMRVPCSAQENPRVLIQRGERFLALGKLEAAAENYAKVIACCKDTADASEAHNDLGVVFMRMGRTDEALDEYEAALASHPYPLAHFNIAEWCFRKFAKTRENAMRERALAEFNKFLAYLDEDKDLPAAVTYQRANIRRYVKDAIASLSQASQDRP